MFTKPHGIFIGPDDTIYCADNLTTPSPAQTRGTLLKTLGEKTHRRHRLQSLDHPGSAVGRSVQHGDQCRPGAGRRDVYRRSYGNARVHKFSADGELLFSWGEPGSGPGQFKIPHSIAVDRRGTVYVADREISRIQVFSADGEYRTEWTHVSRPDDLYIDADENLFVAELGFKVANNAERPGRRSPAPRAPVVRQCADPGRGIQHRFGEHGLEPGNFYAPHGIWADSRGDLYVSEVNYSAGGRQGLIPLDGHVLAKVRAPQQIGV